MVFRIAGGIFLILAAISYLGLFAVPTLLLGLAAGIAGVALLIGA